MWGQVLTKSCLGRAFQVAQTARALHWIVKALRDSGFGSEEGVPTLGEWVAVPAAGLYHLCSFASGGPWGGDAAGPVPRGAWPTPQIHVQSVAKSPA